MLKITWAIIILTGIMSHALDITFNTQLDKKLDKLSKKKSVNSSSFKFNTLRKIEINGLKSVSQNVVRNEITVFKGDELDPYTINRNIKRIKAIGFFHSVESKIMDFEGGKKWIITIKENPVIKDVSYPVITALIIKCCYLN